MTYDLRRLRLHGIIERAPGTQRYTLPLTGARAVFFYTTLHRRLRQLPNLDLLTAPHIPARLSAALNQLDTAPHHLWAATGRAA
jgi:hypothetical protein